MKYNNNGTATEVNIKVNDTLPIGAVVEFNGSAIPSGWTSIGSGKIEKTSQYMNNSSAAISNSYGDSITDGYSQNYINQMAPYTNQIIYANDFKCKNIFDGELEEGAISTTDGSNIADSSKTRSKNIIRVEPSKTYTLSTSSTTSVQFQVFAYNGGGSFIEVLSNNWASAPYTFTVNSNTYGIKIVLNSTNTPLIQIEPGETATTWVEHKDYAGGGSSGTWVVYDLPSLLISYRTIKTDMDGYDPGAELFDAVGSFYWNSVTGEGYIEGAISLNSSILQNYLNAGYNFASFINNYYTIPILTFDNIILPFQTIGSTKFNAINYWIGGIVTTLGELSIDTTHAFVQQLNSYNSLYYLIKEDEYHWI